MPNFLDAIKNFFNVVAIKSSERVSHYPQGDYEKYNVPLITYAMYAGNVAKNSVTPVIAARYYADVLQEEGANAPKQFFLLTVQNGTAVKEKHEVVQNSEAVAAYRDEIGRKRSTKTYYAAAASVFANIQRAAKEKQIVGYTTDVSLAEKFLTFKMPEQLSDEELMHIWNTVPKEIYQPNCATVYARADILENAFPRLKKLIPIPARVYLAMNDRPFDTIFWRVIKHQLELGEPLDETLFKAIEQFSQLREVLEDGYNLNGLNFAKQAQLAVIQKAMVLDENAGGTEYVDELRTENGWLSAEEMVEKYNLHEALMKEAKLTSTMRSEARQIDEERRAMKEQAELKKAQLATARAPFEAKIAELDGALSALIGQRMVERDPNKQLLLDNEKRSLEAQIRQLKEQLNKIK